MMAVAGCGGSATRRATPPIPAGPGGGALAAAVGQMRAAHSFAFTADVRTGSRTVNLVGEFSAPSSVHETITAGGAAPAEIVLVDSTAYRKTATGTWVAGAQPSTASAGDPRAPFDALLHAENLVVSGADTTFEINGDAARTLAGAKSTRVTGTVTIAAGAITRLDYASDDPQHTTVHLGYSAIGSAPPVTAPPTTP